jgi:hypothetical protein
MKRGELAKRVERAQCRVYGWLDASNDGHRAVVAALLDAFDHSESALLVEPSLSRKTDRPPDVVLVDPEVGVIVVEVKAFAIGQIKAIEPGGTLLVQYGSVVRRRHAINQVRTAMFDIKDATARAFAGTLSLRFDYWVAFPSIRRDEWAARFGPDGFCPREFLFAEDLERAALLRTLRATDRAADATTPVRTCRLDELQCVWKAFGDNSVLYVRPEQRPERKVEEGTLGERFDERALAAKQLSNEQQRLSELHWEAGPRLVRGVAGSGKTVVLANNLARRAKRMLLESAGLFDAAPKRRPRLAAVCFNRTLAPFIRGKIEVAYEQRTGKALPPDLVQVHSLNKLMHELSKSGVWAYQPAKSADEATRASRYREQLAQLKQRDLGKFEQLAFDAVYVDEGQDFVEAEFELLRDLCRAQPGTDEPSLFVFYDDAQNLYGHGRPNWASLGLNVRGGRSSVMTECFRNPRPIVETSFNVLYGTALPAGGNGTAPSKDFGDIATLQEKGLIELDGGRWRVKFANRKGRPPLLTLATDPSRETQLVLARLTVLVRDERVRPQDVLVLACSRDRALALADAIGRARLPGVDGVHVAFREKDAALCPPGRVTVSTVHSAKGYDAAVVLLCSANEFPTDVRGRACFYVACTRAVEHLEVFAHQRAGLVAELARLLDTPPH